jgi:hypothetical protein
MPKLQIVTYAYILPGKEVWLPGHYFFILTIHMQALSSGHAPTTIPPIPCASMEISISASTPPTALRSNG